MNSADIKLSFVVPCFNAEMTLTRCFESLSKQTLPNIEFVFVNDGSTDSTWKLLEGFSRSDTRVTVIAQPNSGITAARLAGLNASSGEIITFLDSDDFVDPNVAEEAISLFSASPDIDAVLYNLAYFDPETEAIRHFDYSAIQFPISGENVLRYSIPSWQISTNGFYKKKHAARAYGMVAQNIKSTNSDEIANRLIFEDCDRVALMKSSYYYVHSASSTSNTMSAYQTTRLDSAKWLREYSLSHLGHIVSRKQADLFYLNELCSLMIKYRNHVHNIDESARASWLDRLRFHRKHVLKHCLSGTLRSPLDLVMDLKFVKKLLYLCVLPLPNR